MDEKLIQTEGSFTVHVCGWMNQYGGCPIYWAWCRYPDSIPLQMICECNVSKENINEMYYGG